VKQLDCQAMDWCESCYAIFCVSCTVEGIKTCSLLGTQKGTRRCNLSDAKIVQVTSATAVLYVTMSRVNFVQVLDIASDVINTFVMVMRSAVPQNTAVLTAGKNSVQLARADFWLLVKTTAVIIPVTSAMMYN
jgi:hypothetical protein